MNHFFETYRDEPSLSWEFFIDLDAIDLSSDKILEDVIEKSIDFQKYAINLSHKYSLCEPISSRIVELYSIDKKAFIANYFQEIDKRRKMGYLDYFETFSNYDFADFSSKYSFTFNKIFGKDHQEIYFYNCDLDPLFRETIGNKINIKKDHSVLQFFPGDLLDFRNTSDINTDGIGFFLESYSTLWFDKTFTDNAWTCSDEKRQLAYLNTPRLNSFLRDLKRLWVEEYGWSFDTNFCWGINYSENGVLMDGKIIYQEDIELS